MGNGSSSRPGSQEAKDEDEFKPVKNWEGEVVGWIPRTDSDKLRRKQMKNPPPVIKKEPVRKISPKLPSRKNSIRNATPHKTWSSKPYNIRDDDDDSEEDDSEDGDSYEDDSEEDDRHHRGSSRRTSHHSVRRLSNASYASKRSHHSRDRSSSRRRPSYDEEDDEDFDDTDSVASNHSSRRGSLQAGRNDNHSRRNTYDTRRDGDKVSMRKMSVRVASPSESRHLRVDGEDDGGSRRSSINRSSSRASGRMSSMSKTDYNIADIFRSRDPSPARPKVSISLGPTDDDHFGSKRHSRSQSRNSRYDSDDESSRGRRRRSQKLRYKPIRRYPSPKPSVWSKSRFRKEDSAALLNGAFKGLGTNERVIIEVLQELSRDQRVKVAQSYKGRYSSDLISVLGKELSGNFKKLCVALVCEELAFDVKTFNELIEDTSRQSALIGLLAQTDGRGLKAMRKKFKADYDEDLMVKVKKETKGSYSEVFKAIFSNEKDGGDKVDPLSAQNDAEDIEDAVKARKKDVGRMLLVNFTSKRNANEVREICEAFRQLTDTELTEQVQKLLGEKDARPFNAYIEASDDPASFFANCLHNCFDGAGTDDQCLIRLIASRCEIDLADIAEAYEDFHGKSLTSKIKSETSGDYQNLLLGLLGYEK